MPPQQIALGVLREMVINAEDMREARIEFGKGIIRTRKGCYVILVVHIGYAFF